MSAQNKTPLEQARAKAKPVGQFVNNWIGLSPADIAPDNAAGQFPQKDIDDIVDKDIVIYGYSPREGESSPFAVILATESQAPDEIFVIVTGASVILKKLSKLNEAHALPASGKILHSKGKKFSYYDFV